MLSLFPTTRHLGARALVAATRAGAGCVTRGIKDVPGAQDEWNPRSPFHDADQEDIPDVVNVSTLLPEEHGDEMLDFEPPDEPFFTPPASDLLEQQLAGKELRITPPRFREAKHDAQGRAQAVGKKKSAVARAIVGPGSGAFECNGRSLIAYFPAPQARFAVLEPLMLTERLHNTNVSCNVHGGGPQGQAAAVRHAISKALEVYDPEYRPVLKRAGLLTRDPRVVERKKPGKPKARKSFQWLKR